MMNRVLERYRFARYCVVHRQSYSAQRRWQERYLRRLIPYAYEHVTLWKKFLDDAGIDPDSIRTLDDLQKLPTTSKHTFIGRMVEEYIDNSRPVQAVWYVTSGTSGTPFRFLMSEHAIQEKYSDMASLRFLWWRGVPLSALETTNLVRIKIRGPNRPHRMFVPVEEYLRDPVATLARIADFRPVVLSAYPSILLDMADLVTRDSDIVRPEPPFILSFGEMLAPSVREHVSRTLGSEIYDRYGLEEIGVIGVECERHDGFHINTEAVVVEIVDDAHRPVSPGVEGKIIATDLCNTGMPFIRYDTGDWGRVSYEPCACGLQTPRIWIRGRYTAFLDFPQRRIHHLEFDGAMDGFMNLVLQYQIAKKSDTEIVARIIPGPAYHAGVSEKVQQSLGKLAGANVHIGVEVTDRLPVTSRGKSRIVIDESASIDSK